MIKRCIGGVVITLPVIKNSCNQDGDECTIVRVALPKKAADIMSPCVLTIQAFERQIFLDLNLRVPNNCYQEEKEEVYWRWLMLQYNFLAVCLSYHVYEILTSLMTFDLERFIRKEIGTPWVSTSLLLPRIKQKLGQNRIHLSIIVDGYSRRLSWLVIVSSTYDLLDSRSH